MKFYIAFDAFSMFILSFHELPNKTHIDSMKNILSITSLVLLLTACGGKQEKAENTVVELTPPYNVEIPASISATVDSVFPLSEIASDVEFVQLEVTDESLLRDIFGIKVSDSHILIHDINQVYLFARDGKFLTRVGSQGQGPSEYLHVDKVMLDEKRQEIIVATTTTGIKVYGLDGKYKKTVPDTKGVFGGGYSVGLCSWNDKYWLRNRMPLSAPATDIWTCALADENFRFIKKFYNPDIQKRIDEINNQMRAKMGEDKWVESENPLCDFYGGVLTMSYYAGDTIFRFDEISQDFTPEYILSFAEKPTFEMSHQWGKTDTRFFDYYFPYDYVITKDYFYLFLGHKDKSYIARFNKKDGKMDYAPFENEIIAHQFRNGFTHRRMDISQMFFRNDISGGCPFYVDSKSENGKYLIDMMDSEDIEKYIRMDELKNETVTNEASKQRWIDLLNRLSDDEQIIAIATLK